MLKTIHKLINKIELGEGCGFLLYSFINDHQIQVGHV